eukprot:8318147-Karenia_brevis.AAC.1
MDPRLIVPYLKCFDIRSAEDSAQRNRKKTTVILYATGPQRDANKVLWRLDEVQQLATLHEPTAELLTLGAALGGAGNRHKQFTVKTQA